MPVKYSNEMTHRPFREPEVVSQINKIFSREGVEDFLTNYARTLDRFSKGQVTDEMLENALDSIGAAGTIAGPLAKGANLVKLRAAHKLKEMGFSDDKIWEATQWYLSHPDKVPRWEIPDEPDLLTRNIGYRPLGETFRNKPVDESYPSIPRDYKAEVYRSETGDEGYLIPRTKELGIGQGSPYKMSSTAMHEVQHAIQQLEGMWKGGSPEQIVRDFDDAVKKISEMEKGPERDAAVEWYKKTFTERDPEKVYKSLGGEVDAFLTEGRFFMTPQERLADPFWKAYEGMNIFNPESFKLK